MNKKFAILRRESTGGYSTRGPIAYEMSFAEARAEIVRLKGLYPYQDFVIMGELGEAKRIESVTLELETLSLPVPGRRKRRPAKLEGNVVALPDQKHPR